MPVRTILRLEALGLNRNELQIALARARLKSLMDKQAAGSPKDFLSYEHAILHYLVHITTLIHRNQRLPQKSGVHLRSLTELIDWMED